jgi:hypothetical protein
MIRSVSIPKLFWALAACSGCSSMLGIDGEYVPVELQPGSGGFQGAGDFPSQSGGGTAAVFGSGGSSPVMPGSGGAFLILDAGSSGAVAAGGSAPMEAAVCVPTECGSKQKCCSELSAACLDEAPIVGCSDPSCEPCPAPPSKGIAVCEAGACAILCNDGYTKQGSTCVANGTGGQGGAGGNAGSGGAGGAACVADKCPACNIAGPVKCCRNDGSCGCSWAATFVCY